MNVLQRMRQKKAMAALTHKPNQQAQRKSDAVHIGYQKPVLKYALLTVLVVGFVFTVLETAVLYGLMDSSDAWPSRAAIQASLDATSAAVGVRGATVDENWQRVHMLHPYSGFVRGLSDEGGSQRGSQVNEYGFIGRSPLAEKQPGEVVIAVTGGKAALDLFLRAREAFADELKKSPLFKNRKPVFVSLADDGFKQPQQLTNLSYFLTLGARFDLVVNLDGYDDTVLPFVENAPGGVSPFFPRGWDALSGRFVDPEAAAVTVEMKEVRAGLERSRPFFAAFPIRESNIFLAWWHKKQLAAEHRLTELTARLEQNASASRKRAEVQGPGYAFEDAAAFFQELTGAWGRASLLMASQSRAGGARYFHFLEPNPYPALEGTGDADARYRTAATTAYPQLAAEGRQLAKRGVAFHDLSGLFAADPKGFYTEGYRNLNDAGYEAVARQMARAITADLAKAAARRG